jgi:hypothetical protein
VLPAHVKGLARESGSRPIDSSQARLRVICGSSTFRQARLVQAYLARVKRGGKDMHLGALATAEEAALCVARSPEGRAAAERPLRPRPAVAAPLQAEEARQQAQAEGRRWWWQVTRPATSECASTVDTRCNAKPSPTGAAASRWQEVRVGMFATTEEPALCVHLLNLVSAPRVRYLLSLISYLYP